MIENSADSEKEAFTLWYKQLLGAAVEEMMRVGVVKGESVDAKPAWALPHKILIAKLKESGWKHKFVWIITGEEVLTDHLDASVASSPRDVARHFALKWHLDAERLRNLEARQALQPNPAIDRTALADKFTENAEVLYGLVNLEELWQKQVGL